MLLCINAAMIMITCLVVEAIKFNETKVHFHEPNMENRFWHCVFLTIFECFHDTLVTGYKHSTKFMLLFFAWMVFYST